MTKMKKKMKKTNRRNVQLMAAAVLSAALLSGQVMPVVAESRSTAIETSSIFPDNITIETPVPLSEISLPKCEYGKLSWADDSQVPTKRSEAFEVVFRPSETFDLSRIVSWDGESEKITGYVTVVVSSIEASDEEEYEESWDVTGTEDSYEETTPAEETDADVSEQTTVTEETDADVSGQTEETAAGEGTDGVSGESSSDVTAESPSDSNAGEQTDADTGAEKITEESSEESTAETEKSSENVSEKEDNSTKDTPASDENVESQEETDLKEDQDPVNENSQNAGQAEEENENQPEETPDNIFDRADEEIVDERPETAEENLTEEEMEQRAQVNHSCDGISVSGINLPWYVQFRATSGESYEFTNESEAMIFRSYEFELWDLKNDTEYEIPDGEYISVTIPVKEGYDYTIEHLLDNGATETIIPNVNGSIMIFSTHSFSPFGIAGSKTIVGEEGVENNYTTPTPTTAPTKTPSVPSGSSGSSSGSTANSGGSTGSSTGSTGSSAGSTGSSSTGSTSSSSGNTADSTSGSSGSSNSSGNSAVSDGTSGSTQTEQADNNASSGQTTSSQAVQTGDNTQILPFVILVVAAVIIIVVILFIRRKKK